MSESRPWGKDRQKVLSSWDEGRITKIRQTDRQIDRQSHILFGRGTNNKNRQIERYIHRQTDRQTDKQTDRQTDRSRVKQKNMFPLGPPGKQFGDGSYLLSWS